MEKQKWIAKGQEMAADREERIKVMKKKKFDTVATHGLYDFNQAMTYNFGSIMEPVYMSPAQAFSNSAEMEAALAYEMPSWTYSRIANPSSLYLEETAALLETYGSETRASCCATSSGMSAIRTATDPFLIKDDNYKKPNIVASSKVYGGTFQQFWIRRAEEQGIEVRWVTDSTNLSEWADKVDRETRFVYGEFPSNPAVAIFDIKKVTEIAHNYDCPMIIDTTCASPALTRPLNYGADIVVHSASKVMSASGTSIVGLLIAKENIISKIGPDEMKANFAGWAKLWPFRDNGPSISPMSAFLTLNDMRSLRMRVAHMSSSALKVSKFLENHPMIDVVHYPGLESNSAHAIAREYMTLADTDENMYGYMLAVEIKEKTVDGSANARVFYDKLKMLWRATDLGRVKSVATLNAISTHQQQGETGRKLASIKPSTCRISVGIEDPEDVIADLSQALDAI